MASLELCNVNKRYAAGLIESARAVGQRYRIPTVYHNMCRGRNMGQGLAMRHPGRTAAQDDRVTALGVYHDIRGVLKALAPVVLTDPFQQGLRRGQTGVCQGTGRGGAGASQASRCQCEQQQTGTHQWVSPRGADGIPRRGPVRQPPRH